MNRLIAALVAPALLTLLAATPTQATAASAPPGAGAATSDKRPMPSPSTKLRKEQIRTFTWQQFSNGACTIDSAVMTITDSGNVSFSANTWTTNAGATGHTYDLNFTLRTSANNAIINLPMVHSDLMTVNLRIYPLNQFIGNFDAVRLRFNEIYTVTGNNQCN